MFYKPGSHRENGFKRDPFKAFISPRPIGWISTISSNGKNNLAPYSFFNAVCSDPPCVIFASGGSPDERGKKDSQINAENTGEFVCSIVSYQQKEAMNQTSFTFPTAKTKCPMQALRANHQN